MELGEVMVHNSCAQGGDRPAKGVIFFGHTPLLKKISHLEQRYTVYLVHSFKLQSEGYSSLELSKIDCTCALRQV